MCLGIKSEKSSVLIFFEHFEKKKSESVSVVCGLTGSTVIAKIT